MEWTVKYNQQMGYDTIPKTKTFTAVNKTQAVAFFWNWVGEENRKYMKVVQVSKVS